MADAYSRGVVSKVIPAKDNLLKFSSTVDHVEWSACSKKLSNEEFEQRRTSHNMSYCIIEV